MSEFPFSKAMENVNLFDKASNFYSDAENEKDLSAEDQAHYSLMKAYALISASKR